MRPPGRWVAAFAAVVAFALFLVAAPTDPDEPLRALDLRLKPLPEGVAKVRLETTADGARRMVLTMTDGTEERLTADEFLARVDRDARGRSLVYRVLNITHPAGFAWVALGLLGQAVFAGRMVVQWVVSERRGRSVVPVAFWWMGLVGASMMLVYFIWRRDIVGVLGQCAGWIIYVRNLWLLDREARSR